MPSFLVSILERPFVPTGVLLLAAGILGWLAVSRQEQRLLVAALVAGGLAGIVVLLSFLVTTPGGHGERLVERLVRAAEVADFDGPQGMFAALSDDASLHFGSESSPGTGIEGLKGAFRSLGRRHRIRDNAILSLDGETTASDRARVTLTCRTETDSSQGASVVTRWVFEVRLAPDGAWRIRRVTFETLAGRPADPGILR